MFPDALAVVIALLALIVSAISLFRQWHADKRRTFLEVTGRLVQEDLQRGRRELYRLDGSVDFASWRRDEPAEYDVVNRALSELEILAYMVAKGYIPYSMVEDFWGRVLLGTVKAARPFIEHRDEEAGRSIWPNLITLHARIERGGRYS